MITHRFLSAIFVIVGLFRFYLSLLLVSGFSYSEILMTIGGGSLLGGSLNFLCLSWIKRKHVKGIVTLNIGILGVIALVFMAIGVLSLDSLITSKMLPHPCVFFFPGSDIWCAQQWSLFRVTGEVTWAMSLFVWGLVYERKIGYRLTYRIPFDEKTN